MSLIYLSNKNEAITITTTDKIDTIILAPSLYWVQTLTIPTKNKRKAKNIASHMMSNKPKNFTEIFLIPLDKSKSTYKVYAYDKSSVDEYIQKMQINNYKLYLADQLQFNEALKIGEIFLRKVNERIMELPYTGDKHKVQNYNAALLQNAQAIAASQFSEKKSDFLFKTVIISFIVYMLLHGIYNWQILHNIETKIKELDTKNGDMSSYQRKALIHKYETLKNHLVELRTDLKKTLDSTKDIKKISYKNGSIKVETE